MRQFWIDLIKATAILMVILAHIGYVFVQIPTAKVTVPGAFFVITSIIADFGVPFFLMVSGALLLRKKFSTTSDILIFYKKNFLPLLFVAEQWIVLYYFLKTDTPTLKGIILNVLMFQKPEVHLWYVRLITIYYLLTPVLVHLHTHHRHIFYSLLSAITLFTFVYNGYLVFSGSPCPTTSVLSYTCYLIYMYAGYRISQSRMPDIVIPIFIVTIPLVSLLLFYSITTYGYMLWYDNPLILILSLSLFATIKHLFQKPPRTTALRLSPRVVTSLSSMTYGIYLSHFLFIYPLQHLLPYIGYTIPTFLLSFVIVTTLTILLILTIKALTPALSRIVFRY